jgi:hypothetical protein
MRTRAKAGKSPAVTAASKVSGADSSGVGQVEVAGVFAVGGDCARRQRRGRRVLCGVGQVGVVQGLGGRARQLHRLAAEEAADVLVDGRDGGQAAVLTIHVADLHAGQ